MTPDRTLEGTVTSLYSPVERHYDQFRRPLRRLADGKHVAIVANSDHGPDSLLETFRSMLALRGLGRRRPPPTLIISDPPFGQGASIRVPVDETHLQNVYIQAGSVVVL